MFLSLAWEICSKDAIQFYDTLLYHSSIVSWLNYSKIVPGLANLHSRLGMNSSYLMLAAGIDVGIFDKYSSSVLPMIFYFAAQHYFCELIAGEKYSKPLKFFSCAMLLWFIVCKNPNPLPGLGYDIPAMVFIAVIFSELLAMRELKMHGNAYTSWEILFVFAAMSFAIKQMGAIMVIFIFVLGMRDMLAQKKSSGNGIFVPFLKFCAVPLIFAVTYIIRNIIQTGFPLYPLTILPTKLVWANYESANGCLDAIKYWARLPGPGYMRAKTEGFLFWFPTWLKTNLKNNMVCFLCLLLSCGFLLHGLLCALKENRKKIADFLIFFFAVVANILFWFVSAPDFRFGSVFFFLLLGICFYFCDDEKKSRLLFALFVLNLIYFEGHKLKVFLLALDLLALFSVFMFNSPKKKYFARIVLILLTYFCLNTPHRHARLSYPVKAESLPVRKITLENGQTPALEVYVPVSGDQTGDAPLPCTPYPTDRLKLINPNDMRNGFYLED
mgnify:CR=1 FL=1